MQEQAAGTETLVTIGAMGPATHQRDDYYATFYLATATSDPLIIRIRSYQQIVVGTLVVAMYTCNQNNILCHGTGVKCHNCHSEDQSLRIVSPRP